MTDEVFQKYANTVGGVNASSDLAGRREMNRVVGIFQRRGAHDYRRQVSLDLEACLVAERQGVSLPSADENEYLKLNTALSTSEGKELLEKMGMADVLGNRLRSRFLQGPYNIAERTHVYGSALHALVATQEGYSGPASITEPVPGEEEWLKPHLTSSRQGDALSDEVVRNGRLLWWMDCADALVRDLNADRLNLRVYLGLADELNKQIRRELEVAQVEGRYLRDVLQDCTDVYRAVGLSVSQEQLDPIIERIGLAGKPAVAQELMTISPFDFTEEESKLVPTCDVDRLVAFSRSREFDAVRKNLRTDEGEMLLWMVVNPAKSLYEGFFEGEQVQYPDVERFGYTRR